MIELEIKEPTCKECNKTMSQEASKDENIIFACLNCKTLVIQTFKVIKDATSKTKKHPRTETIITTKRQGSVTKTIVIITEKPKK